MKLGVFIGMGIPAYPINPKFRVASGNQVSSGKIQLTCLFIGSGIGYENNTHYPTRIPEHPYNFFSNKIENPKAN